MVIAASSYQITSVQVNIVTQQARVHTSVTKEEGMSNLLTENLIFMSIMCLLWWIPFLQKWSESTSSGISKPKLTEDYISCFVRWTISGKPLTQPHIPSYKMQMMCVPTKMGRGQHSPTTQHTPRHQATRCLVCAHSWLIKPQVYIAVS